MEHVLKRCGWVALAAPSCLVTFFNGRRDRLEAFRLGNRAVLTEVFQVYADDVSKILRHGFRLDARQLVVRGVTDAEREKELLQEVFIRAFSERARKAYNGLSPYRPYLLQIARNLLVDELRKAGLPATDISAEELEAAPALDIPADEVLAMSALREATTDYLQSLPLDLSHFVQLRFEAGMSQAQVAEHLNVTRRKVRTWETTVQEGLRAALEARKLLEE